MGAWSPEILDNDDAMDFALLWQEYVAPGTQSDPKRWTSAAIVKFFQRVYFQGRTDFDDPKFSAEVLALGALFRQHGIRITPSLKGLLEQAIHAELENHKLREWDDPADRKRVLEKFLADIGGKRRKAARNPADKEIETLRKFTKRFKRWIRVVKGSYNDKDFEEQFPDFLEQLRKLIRRDFETIPDEKQFRLIQFRLMLLAFFTGWKLDMPEKEILELIKRAEKTKGFVLI